MKLDSDVTRILSKGNKFVMPVFSATLHTPVEDYEIAKILHIDITRDFLNSLTDLIEITFLMPLGDYRDVIYKYLDKLEITITINFRDNLGNSKYSKPVIFKKRFKFIPKEIDKRFTDSKYDKFTRDYLNKLDMKTVEGACKSIFLTAMKQLYINGIYKDYDLTTLLKMLYSKYVPLADVSGKVYSMKYAFEPFDNQDTFNHVIIDNKKLITLPYVFQQGDYGIYYGGLGLYYNSDIYVTPLHEQRLMDNQGITDYTMYLYPLYDHKRFQTTTRDRLIIYSTEVSRISSNNITYYRSEDEIGDFEILVPQVIVNNKGKLNLLDTGDSLYERNPANILTKPYIMEYYTGSLFMNLNDIVTIEEASDNDTFIRNYVDTNFDYNLYKYKERILKSLTNVYQVTLPQSDFRIFYPGMPIKYNYYKNGVVDFIYGTLYKTVTTYNIVKESSSTVAFFGGEVM